MSVYEPWVPAPGQRVVVRISGECPVGHTYFHGCTGRVAEASWSADLGEDDFVGVYRGHWYWVDFDEPVESPYQRYPIRAEMFAAVELDPAP